MKRIILSALALAAAILMVSPAHAIGRSRVVSRSTVVVRQQPVRQQVVRQRVVQQHVVQKVVATPVYSQQVIAVPAQVVAPSCSVQQQVQAGCSSFFVK